MVVAPPSLYLLLTREHLDPRFEVAAQNVFDKPPGAFTGEISAAQLKDSGITWTLLGHSERRTVLKEDDGFIASKTKSATDHGVGVILCCGESLEEREKGTTVEVVTRQLDAVNKAVDKEAWKNIVIAYEPIWAIGTGKVATIGESDTYFYWGVRELPLTKNSQNKHKKSTQLSETGYRNLSAPKRRTTPESSMEAVSVKRIAGNSPRRRTLMGSWSVVLVSSPPLSTS